MIKKFFKYFLSITLIMIVAVSGVIAVFFFSGMDTPAAPDDMDEIIKGRVNILVLGESGGNTDTMMVVSLDGENKTLDVLSIPRDTRVKINGSYQKINAAYALGKEELAIKTVKELTGLPINYYVFIDHLAFREFIDALGGVEIDVKRNYKYDDPAQDLHIDIKKGKQVLNGYDAEGYVRYRHDYVNGDLDRIAVQQDFLKELVKQKANLLTMATKISDVYNVMQERVKTNLSLRDLLAYIPAAKQIDPSQVRTHVLPSEPKYINNISYVIANEKEIDQLMVTYFGLEIPGVSPMPSPLPSSSPETGSAAKK